MEGRDDLELRRAKALAAALAVLFVIAWQAPPLRLLQGVDLMPLWMHMLMETVTVAISTMIFGVVWHAYDRERSGNIVILACGLFALGLIGFGHMLSFRGMPDFITPSGREKGLNFWLASRFAGALGMLIAALRPWQPFAHPHARYIALAVSLAGVALVYWLGLFHPGLWPRTFIEGQGLTTFKIATEYVVIALMLVPAAVFFVRAEREASPESACLFSAVVIMILSELCFTLYSDVTDLFNLLGHIYEVAAFALFYRAVFVVSVREPDLRLHDEIKQHQRTEAELLRYREHLEELVAGRTRQLDEANKELEAFSYSVSHDLRAPLRSIDGFSQVLLSKYSASLDEKGQDYLQRVRRACQRMGQLIDDMLHLARVSRREISLETVDVSDMARQVADELSSSAPERRVEFDIRDGIEVKADPQLLRIALENLLGNAWKFTSRKAETVIAVGETEKDGERAVFVRDNGAGFNMDYAHKLFAPFQRLHSTNDYEGTGIGLATVQRIVRRHGGRIWAEAREGEGATFYLTCGNRMDTKEMKS